MWPRKFSRARRWFPFSLYLQESGCMFVCLFVSFYRHFSLVYIIYATIYLTLVLLTPIESLIYHPLHSA